MDHLFSTSPRRHKWGNAFLKTVDYKSDMKKTTLGAVVMEGTEFSPRQ